MDLTKIADIKELKALAYDAIATKELAEKNLMIINQRIEQVAKEAERKIEKVIEPKK